MAVQQDIVNSYGQQIARLGIIQLENNQFTNSEMDVSVSGSRNVSSIQRGCFSPFLFFDSGSPFLSQKR